MADSERDLNIRVTADGSQASAAISDLQQKLNAATIAVADFSDAAAKGAETTDASFATAQQAVAALDAAMVEAGGGTEAMRAQLATLDAVLSGVTVEMYDAAAASTAVGEAEIAAAADAMRLAEAQTVAGATAATASKGFNVMGAEATLARGNLGGLARAISTVGGPIAEIVLPLLVLEGLFRLIPGLSTNTQKALEALGFVSGETAKQVDAANKAFEGTQKTLYDLAAAQRQYSVFADLAAASGLKYDGVVEQLRQRLEAAQAPQMLVAEGMASLGVSTEQAAKRLDELNTNINTIRATNPQLAASFAAVVPNIIANAGAFDAFGIRVEDAFKKIEAAAKVSQQQMNEWVNQYGKDFPAALGKFEGTVNGLIPAMNKLSAAGLTQQEVYKVLGSQINSTASFAQEYANVIDHLTPAQQAAAAEAIRLAQAHGGLATAISNTNQKIADIAKEYDKSEKAVAESVAKMRATLEADVVAVDARTEHTVGSIHAQEEALRQQWISGTIGQADYRTKMDALISSEDQTYSDSAAEKDKLAKAEAESEKTKVDAWVEQSARLKEQLGKDGETIETARGKLLDYQKSQEAVVQAQRDEIADLIAGVTPHETMNAVVKEGSAQWKANQSALASVVKQHNEYNKAVSKTPKLHAAVAKSYPWKKAKG